jgi:DNA-binding NtrC family response regulator
MAAAWPTAGAARHALAELDEVRVGRGPNWSAQRAIEGGRRILSVCTPDMYASRDHARLIRVRHRWVVQDTASKNGLRINGGWARRRWLEDGDLLQVGETFFFLRTDMQVPEDEPPDVTVAAGDGPAPGMATVVPELAANFARLARLARSPLPVLLLGETGTGKDVLASACHKLSNRPGALVAVNCGALPPTLLESNLFGHLRGAFTGASEDRRGLFASAEGGTLFLDEIAELPLPSQAALLRALQNREVMPIGATRALPVDVRIVAASNRDLEERVRAGAFRDDLLARLKGFQFELPPVRARREDLGLLVAAMWDQPGAGRGATRLTADAAQALLRHSWPHNARELEQALVAARSLAADAVELDDLPPAVLRGASRPDEPAKETREALRREELCALLTHHAGNVSRVARALRTSRAQVHRLCHRLGLDVRAFREHRQAAAEHHPENGSSARSD